jgi:hypothetical protein
MEGIVNEYDEFFKFFSFWESSFKVVRHSVGGGGRFPLTRQIQNRDSFFTKWVSRTLPPKWSGRSVNLTTCLLLEQRIFNKRRIWCSHSGSYEFCSLRYKALQPDKSHPIFRRNMWPLSSESKNKTNKKPTWEQMACRVLIDFDFQRTTRCYTQTANSSKLPLTIVCYYLLYLRSPVNLITLRRMNN